MGADLADEAGKTVLISEYGGCCRILLNRPERLNAITAGLLVELLAALKSCAGDASIRAVLISGNGRAFCAGQDLNERDPRVIAWPPDLERLQKELFHPVILAMKTLAKPVIVAVNGIAAGAGCSLALAGDIVFAARSAEFIQSFAKIGLSVDAGGGWHLSHALGSAKAKGWLMTAESMSAAEAEAAGLIWKCVDDGMLLDEAGAMAARLAKGPTRAFAARRRLRLRRGPAVLKNIF
jgi:2-(1,2-epoxy-1,2-dihydrophenyl)acetyl-CoA isomerase